MTTLRDRVLSLIRSTSGLTDREITDRLLGTGSVQQGVNQAARALTSEGLVIRHARHDGKLGNYPAEVAGESPTASESRAEASATDSLSEDDIKRKLQAWLEAAGWKVTVVWGRGQGVDIEARHLDRRWVI